MIALLLQRVSKRNEVWEKRNTDCFGLVGAVSSRIFFFFSSLFALFLYLELLPSLKKEKKNKERFVKVIDKPHWKIIQHKGVSTLY